MGLAVNIYSFKEGLKGQYMHLYCVFKMNDPICRAGVRSEQSLVIDRCYHVMTKTSPNLLKIGTLKDSKGEVIFIIADKNFKGII